MVFAPPADALICQRSELARAGLELFRDGVLRVPGLEAIERPDLAGSFDLIGFSFYSTIGIKQGRMVAYPQDAPVSPLGYGIWADGLGSVLGRLNEMLPGTPLLVAECGIGTGDDRQRAAYLERGLQVTSDAIAWCSDARLLRSMAIPVDVPEQARVSSAR